MPGKLSGTMTRFPYTGNPGSASAANAVPVAKDRATASTRRGRCISEQMEQVARSSKCAVLCPRAFCWEKKEMGAANKIAAEPLTFYPPMNHDGIGMIKYRRLYQLRLKCN
eukprot:1535131-Rhodomonas_salina.1